MPKSRPGPIPGILSFSRWPQVPLHLGLIVAQGVCVRHFMAELAEDRK